MSQVELYMAELYNKIGLGLITWSPLSLGLCSSKPEDQFSLFTKLAVKVRGGGYFIQGEAGNNIFTLSAERKIQQGWPRHAQPQ